MYQLMLFSFFFSQYFIQWNQSLFERSCCFWHCSFNYSSSMAINLWFSLRFLSSIVTKGYKLHTVSFYSWYLNDDAHPPSARFLATICSRLFFLQFCLQRVIGCPKNLVTLWRYLLVTGATKNHKLNNWSFIIKNIILL